MPTYLSSNNGRSRRFDITFLGNYTQDTIVSAAGTRRVDGGGFNYGAHVAAMMDLRTAAVTRLAIEDVRVVDRLAGLGVAVFPTYTPYSTHMRLFYPTDNLDERVLSVTQTAGAFTPDQFDDIESRVFIVNGSSREEVPLDVMRHLWAKDTRIAADAQAFVRIIMSDGVLRSAPWPEKQDTLAMVHIMKADAVEAEMMTGITEIREAARMIASWGPEEVVITHRGGVLVLADGRFHEADFRPRQLVGRSGRGDTCLASYAGRRLTAPPEDAIVWSAAVTSLKLEAEGPIAKTVADVERLIARCYAGSVAEE